MGVQWRSNYDLTPLADFDANNWAPTKGGFALQAKAFDRAVAYDDCVMLTTQPGDDHIAGSGAMERCDLALSVEDSNCIEGEEAWWAHRIMFPREFLAPRWNPYVVFDFHGDGKEGINANFHINFHPGMKDTDPGQLALLGYGGDPKAPAQFGSVLGPIQRYRWYKFEHHVWWSATDGFFATYLDGELVLYYRGPTLYIGQNASLKLANYHLPPRAGAEAIDGPHLASSVIHGPVVRATSRDALSL